MIKRQLDVCFRDEMKSGVVVGVEVVLDCVYLWCKWWNTHTHDIIYEKRWIEE